MTWNSKKIVLLASLLAVGVSLKAQEENFTISIKMSSPRTGHKAFLYYKDSRSQDIVDSAAYQHGKFQLKGKTTAPQRAFISLAQGNKGYGVYSVVNARIPVYLEAGNIIISGNSNLLEAKLSGTPLNADFQGYHDVVNSFSSQLNLLREQFGSARLKKDMTALAALDPLFRNLDKKTKKAEERYFLAHLNSLVSLDWLKDNFVLANDKPKAAELFAMMGDGVKKSSGGQAYSELLSKTQIVKVGNTAPDFTAKDTEDKSITLSSFRGKYVLLDFWASWCGPCRAENPNVLKAYNSYRSHNFTVIGFSIDAFKSSWLNAVSKDALPWTQLSCIGQTVDIAGVLYGVTGIPSNFLIDPQGKIIARDLRGDELEKVLENLFKG